MEIDLKKIQGIEFKILLKIKKICDENDIQFFLLGGTLLGAIRHKDFIPWDDDVDIGMTRENYEKFIKVSSSKLEQPYFVQHFTTDKNYPLSFCKVLDTSIKFREKRVENENAKNGLYVDIFPFDKMPDNKLLRKIQLIKYKFYNSYIEVLLGWRRPTGKNRPIKIIMDVLNKKEISELVDIRQKIMEKYNSSDKVGYYYNISSQYGPDRERIEVSEINKLKKVKFKSEKFPVHENFDDILKRQYGDYMVLPKEKERFAKHMDEEERV